MLFITADAIREHVKADSPLMLDLLREAARIVAQVKANPDQPYDTCFRYILEKHLIGE